MKKVETIVGQFHQLELPGEDLVLKGFDDLKKGVESVESLLVRIGAPRLRRLGFEIPEDPNPEFPEARLYRLMEHLEPENAHSAYNAYVRRLVSFESTLENIRFKS